MDSQRIYIARVGWWGWWGVFLYLLIRRQCMIRGVPITMATIVHYVHYNRLRVPFRLWQRDVTRWNNNITMTAQHVPFHFDTFLFNKIHMLCTKYIYTVLV